VARPCHISFSRIVAIWRCNWIHAILYFFFSLENGELGFIVLGFDCCEIQDSGSRFLYAFGILLLQITQSTFLYLFPCVLIES